MPIDSVTLSDKRSPGERALTRRSVRIGNWRSHAGSRTRMIVLRSGDGLASQHLGNHRAANAIQASSSAVTDYVPSFRQERRPGKLVELLTPQLSPVCRKAEAGCISSPVRSSGKLRRDLPEVRHQGLHTIST
jgi:hypothetical protein